MAEDRVHRTVLFLIDVNVLSSTTHEDRISTAILEALLALVSKSTSTRWGYRLFDSNFSPLRSDSRIRSILAKWRALHATTACVAETESNRAPPGGRKNNKKQEPQDATFSAISSDMLERLMDDMRACRETGQVSATPHIHVGSIRPSAEDETASRHDSEAVLDDGQQQPHAMLEPSPSSEDARVHLSNTMKMLSDLVHAKYTWNHMGSDRSSPPHSSQQHGSPGLQWDIQSCLLGLDLSLVNHVVLFTSPHCTTALASLTAAASGHHAGALSTPSSSAPATGLMSLKNLFAGLRLQVCWVDVLLAGEAQRRACGYNSEVLAYHDRLSACAESGRGAPRPLQAGAIADWKLNLSEAERAIRGVGWSYLSLPSSEPSMAQPRVAAAQLADDTTGTAQTHTTARLPDEAVSTVLPTAASATRGPSHVRITAAAKAAIWQLVTGRSGRICTVPCQLCPQDAPAHAAQRRVEAGGDGAEHGCGDVGQGGERTEGSAKSEARAAVTMAAAGAGAGRGAGGGFGYCPVAIAVGDVTAAVRHTHASTVDSTQPAPAAATTAGTATATGTGTGPGAGAAAAALGETEGGPRGSQGGREKCKGRPRGENRKEKAIAHSAPQMEESAGARERRKLLAKASRVLAGVCSMRIVGVVEEEEALEMDVRGRSEIEEQRDRCLSGSQPEVRGQGAREGAAREVDGATLQFVVASESFGLCGSRAGGRVLPLVTSVLPKDASLQGGTGRGTVAGGGGGGGDVRADNQMHKGAAAAAHADEPISPDGASAGVAAVASRLQGWVHAMMWSEMLGFLMASGRQALVEVRCRGGKTFRGTLSPFTPWAGVLAVSGADLHLFSTRRGAASHHVGSEQFLVSESQGVSVRMSQGDPLMGGGSQEVALTAQAATLLGGQRDEQEGSSSEFDDNMDFIFGTQASQAIGGMEEEEDGGGGEGEGETSPAMCMCMCMYTYNQLALFSP